MGSLSGVGMSGRRLVRAMSEPAPKPDPIDEAIARYETPRTLEELMKGVPVFESWDQLDIPDLTDEERKAFADALADDE